MINEAKAVRAVQILLDSCDFLTHAIKENDKGMSWDGEISVFTSAKSNKKVSDLYGKVPIQVKGHNTEFNKNKGHKETIKLVDLNNYLEHGGTVYFVVINTNTGPLVLYKMLLPVDIIELTDGKLHQKTVSVPMEVFPEQPQQMLRILSKFIQNRKPQFALTRDGYKKNKEFFQSGKFHSFSFHPGLSLSSGNYLQDLTAEDQYMYFQVNELPAEFSIGRVEKIHFTQEIDMVISVKKEPYYSKATRTYQDGKIVICFGRSFSFELKDPQDKDLANTIFSYHAEGTLNERITDNQFLIAMFSNKHFEISGDQIDISGIADLWVSEIEREQLMLINAQRMLRSLGIHDDFPINSLAKKEANILFEMGLCFSKNIRPSFVEENVLVQRIVLGDISISMLSLPDEKGWPYRDYFSEKFLLAVSDDSSYPDPVPISQYLIVSDYEIFLSDNFDSEFVLQDIVSTQNNVFTLNWKNHFLLMLLKGYDESKQERLLKLAIQVADHIHKIEKSDTSSINLYQSLKRMRPLNNNEKLVIRNIYEENWAQSKGPLIQLACCMLLDDEAQAKTIFENLSVDVKEQFLNWPISVFVDLS